MFFGHFFSDFYQYFIKKAEKIIKMQKIDKKQVVSSLYGLCN